MIEWGRFAGCMARLDRAREHRDDLVAEWGRYVDSRPASMSYEVDDDGRGRVVITRHEPPPHRLSLLLGEYLYELRAALDNCVYEVAVHYSGQDPPPGEAVLQFPIYESPEAWGKNLYRLKHLSDEHRAMFERVQPYQAERRDLNPMRLLNRLARNDRHRALHVVGSAIAEGGLLVEAPEGARVAEQDTLNGMIIGDGTTVIATFKIEPWEPGQQLRVHAQIELEFEIAEMVADRPWGNGPATCSSPESRAGETASSGTPRRDASSPRSCTPRRSANSRCARCSAGWLTRTMLSARSPRSSAPRLPPSTSRTRLSSSPPTTGRGRRSRPRSCPRWVG
jgi:hypothetical protein